MSDPTATRSASHRSGTTSPIRRSLEVEYWVVDETGRLTAPDGLVDAAPGVEREFVEPLLEIKTSPCETTDELRSELFERLGRVLGRADAVGKRLVPLATPIYRGDIEDRPSERTRIQDRVVGENFECVRHCAGTHMHFEQQPGFEIDQLNALIALDPALALVNSSPYYRGERLVTGARSKLYRRMAYERLPHQGQLWPYADDREEWARRLERRYGEFLTEAVLAGVDLETAKEEFAVESAVWTPVQLRERFSTVEWRSPDTALPTQIVGLADEITEVIRRVRDGELRIGGETGRVMERSVVVPEFGAIQEYVEASIYDGLESDAVRSYLDRMGFDVAAYEPLAGSVDAGTEVSEEEARAIRLEYADRLEADIEQERSVLAD
jgi:hypothetical protein